MNKLDYHRLRNGVWMWKVLMLCSVSMSGVVERPLEVWWGSYRYNEQLVDSGASGWETVREEMDGYLLHGAYWNYAHMRPHPDEVGPKLAGLLGGKPVIVEHLLAGEYPGIDSAVGYGFAGNEWDAAGFGSAVANIKRLQGYGFAQPDVSTDYIMTTWQEAVRWHPEWTSEEFFTALSGNWETYGGVQFNIAAGSVDRQRYGWFRQWVERLADVFPGIRVTATNSPVYFPWEEDGVIRRELGGSLNNFFTWLKLERRGGEVRAMYSGDGKGWAELGRAELGIEGAVRVGVVVASGGARQATGRFDNVAVYPFFMQDIGNPGRGGSLSASGGVFTLQTNGDHGLHPGSNSRDAQYFVYREWEGDGEFVARLVSLAGSNPNRTNPAAECPTAGLTIREGTGANARQVMLHANLANQLLFKARGTVGGGLAHVSGSGSPRAASGIAGGARWLRLIRSGSEITAAASTDGSTWTTLGRVTVAFGSTVQVGLVADSQVTFERATAVFSNVSFMAPASYTWTGTTIGEAGSASSVSIGGTTTVNAAGIGVVAGGDHLRLHATTLTGDGTIVVRLNYFADTAQPAVSLAVAARMGLALRADNTPGAVSFNAMFTPDDGLLALARRSSGGAVELVGSYGKGEVSIQQLGNQYRPLLHYFTGNDFLGTLHEAFPDQYFDNFAGFTTDSPYAGYQKWGGSETHPDALAHRRKIIMYERWLQARGREHQFIANSAGGTDFNSFNTATQVGRDAWDQLYKDQSLRSLVLHQLEGGRPDMVLFESWYDGPFTLVPETREGSFTNLVRDGLLYVKGLGQVLDLAVRVEGTEEFAGADVQQQIPHGTQRIYLTALTAGQQSSHTVRLSNQGTVAALPVLQAEVIDVQGWGVRCYIGTTDVTAAITSASGFAVSDSTVRGEELVAPGASVDMRVELTALAGNADAEERAAVVIRAWWNPQDPTLVHRDAVALLMYPEDRYEDWAAAIDWQGADPSPTADPDRDGLVNRLEYALGLDPLTAQARSFATPELNSGMLRFRFNRIDDPQLTYQLMRSNDLHSWTEIWSSTGTSNLAGEVMVEVPLATQGPCFLQLRIN